MSRIVVRLVSAAVIFGSSAALAQTSRKIPVERDLERLQRIEDRLDYEGTGSIGRYPYRPYYVPGRAVAAPDVPGFGGPPGAVLRDSVGNSGPLPPGSPVNVGNE